MGSWNETCALTHLPIHEGADVVALTQVNGPDYKTENSGGRTALLFGFPLEGKYDSYGGIEDYANPTLAERTAKAFDNTGFYKRWEFKQQYGGNQEKWIVAHRETLWSLGTKLQTVFARELGMVPSDFNSYETAAQDKAQAAYKKTQRALEALGDALQVAQLNENWPQAQAELLALVGQAFGVDNAWHAWDTLCRSGLFASRQFIFMHKTAYTACVTEFGKRKVGFHQSGARKPLREFIDGQLTEHLSRRATPKPDPLEELLRTARRNQGALPPPNPFVGTWQRLSGNEASSRYIRPLTALWQAPIEPLVGHFWGGASYDEILAAESREKIVDYLVFQWAINYLRLDFVKPAAGSQNEETVLPHKIFSAVTKQLKATGQFRTDFSGTLHR